MQDIYTHVTHAPHKHLTHYSRHRPLSSPQVEELLEAALAEGDGADAEEGGGSHDMLTDEPEGGPCASVAMSEVASAVGGGQVQSKPRGR